MIQSATFLNELYVRYYVCALLCMCVIMYVRCYVCALIATFQSVKTSSLRHGLVILALELEFLKIKCHNFSSI